MNIDLIIGIDPGKSNGAIAHRRKDENPDYIKMPKSYDDMRSYFDHLRNISRSPIAVVEQVNMYPGDMKNVGKLYQLQKLFRHYQQILDALHESKIKHVVVMPRVWQSFLSLEKKGEDYADRKRRFANVARTYFKDKKVTQTSADAMLLTQFLKLKMIADTEWIHKHLQGERKFEIQQNSCF